MSAYTLDNMTPEALRDLAARATKAANAAQACEDAKATAKKEAERKANIVSFPGNSGYAYNKAEDQITVGASSGWRSRFNNDTFNRAIRDAENGLGMGDLADMVRFLKALLESKGQSV